MKLSDFGDELLFDEFPKIFNPNQIIIFTHLMNANKFVLPQTVPKVYTSKNLAPQLLQHFKSKNENRFVNEHIVILTPYVPMQFKFMIGKVSMLVCDASDGSANLMVLLKSRNARHFTHIYAGCFTDIPTVILNDEFVKWTLPGIDRLYVNVERANEKYDPLELNNAIDKIVKLLDPMQAITARIHVPPMGYDKFTEKLKYRYRSRFPPNEKFAEFQQKLNKWQINYDINEQTLNIERQLRKETPIKEKIITIQICEKSTKVDSIETDNYYVKYSPLPTLYDLRLLANIVRPRHIHAIPTMGSSLMTPPKVPDCLRMRKDTVDLHKQKANIQELPEAPHSSPKKATTSPIKTYCRRNTKITYVSDSDETE